MNRSNPWREPQAEGVHRSLNFQRPVLVYVPCRNCEKKIEQTLGEIPEEFFDRMECLVVDNHSPDRTSQIVSELIRNRTLPFKVHLIRTREDLGYAGSQKLAFSLALQSPAVKRVIMLHGDGQYPPELLKDLLPHLESKLAVVTGYRSKKVFPEKEETPFVTNQVIRVLSSMESFCLGIDQKEWHSGFVMYHRDFLARVPFQHLSPWMHIDGEFLICAAMLGEETLSIPIYKRYKEFEAFRGLPRLLYLGHVLLVVLRYRTGHYHRLLKRNPPPVALVGFDLLSDWPADREELCQSPGRQNGG